MKEKEVLSQCIQYLQLKGYLVIRNNTGAIPLPYNGKIRLIKFGLAGSPDIIACSPTGRFVAVECKSEKGQLTKKQEAFLKELKKKNAIVVIARSVEDLIKQLGD